MPRNHFTRAIHDIEDRRRARREKELEKLRLELRGCIESPTTHLVDEAKQRRRARLARNRQYKPGHVSGL